jgi:hypothetical protein
MTKRKNITTSNKARRAIDHNPIRTLRILRIGVSRGKTPAAANPNKIVRAEFQITDAHSPLPSGLLTQTHGSAARCQRRADKADALDVSAMIKLAPDSNERPPVVSSLREFISCILYSAGLSDLALREQGELVRATRNCGYADVSQDAGFSVALAGVRGRSTGK